MKREIYIPSTDNRNKLHVIVWEPEVPVRAILQIAHGMVEYVDRFDAFAKAMNELGILVIGNDHLGHGMTVKSDQDFGYFAKGKSVTVVDDLHQVTVYAKTKYKKYPYFLFGHSMGSFMASRYMMTFGEELDGAILSGTGYTPTSVVRAGSFVAGWLKLIRGDRYRSPFLKKLNFAGFLDRISEPRTPNDWLTRDEAVVDLYNADKFCTFTFTVNGYQTLFEVLSYIQKSKNIEKIPKTLPVFIISGGDDPVGGYGEGVKRVYDNYKSANIQDVRMRIYEGDRHELTNEIGKEFVFYDIGEWILKHIKK